MSRSSARSHSCVSGVPIDIHQKCNLAIRCHKAGTENVSFFLVYIILITWVDLDLAKKSTDVAFQKEPLVWIAVGHLWGGVKVLRCVFVHATITWSHWCIIAKHICSVSCGSWWHIWTQWFIICKILDQPSFYIICSRALICPWNIMKSILLLTLPLKNAVLHFIWIQG